MSNIVIIVQLDMVARAIKKALAKYESHWYGMRMAPSYKLRSWRCIHSNGS